MRMIGQLSSETSAKIFGGYLASLEIKNQVEPDTDGRWSIWIYSEDQLDKGKQLLGSFLQNPTDPKFQQAAKAATAIQARETAEQEKFAEKAQTRETLWPRMAIGPLTLLLIAVSVVVAFISKLGADFHSIRGLYISFYQGNDLPEVRSGQFWRLLTPIFIHFGPWHLLFNMLVLKDLGTMIESRQGTGKLAALVVVIALLSNLGQYFMNGAEFGGMSGVTYGLFGYIWIRGKTDPASGLTLDSNTVLMGIAWFFLCLFHVIPNVANTVHAVGLVAGILWGALPLTRKIFQD